MTAVPLVGDGMFAVDLECDAADVVYVKSIASACDGLCCLFSDGAATLQLAAPNGREAEVELLVNDLVEELVVRR